MPRKLLIVIVCLAVVAALVPSYVGATSGGITETDTYWWGFWVYLSHHDCVQIELTLGSIATAGAFYAFIATLPGITLPVAGVIGLGSALIGLGALVILALDINDTGIKIRLNWTFVPPLVLIPTWWGAQPADCGTVTGQVTDEATGNALPYSTVKARQVGQVIVSVETDSNGRYSIALSPGTYIVTASYSGYLETDQCLAVSDDSSTTLNIQLPLIQQGGGGGCPFLYVWDGGGFVDEGLFNIHNAGGVDVTYERVLVTMPEPVNGAYEFRLVEHPQTVSHIDRVQLCAILGDGTIEELHLMSAQHSEYSNVLNLLLGSDDRRAQEIGADHNGGISQSIELKFTTVRPNVTVVGFIFTIEGYNLFYKT